MYVAASALLHDKFMAAMSDNQIPDFAVVVAQGNGHPSDETKLKMKEYYGFVHEDDADNDNIQISGELN